MAYNLTYSSCLLHIISLNRLPSLLATKFMALARAFSLSTVRLRVLNPLKAA